MLYLFWCLDGVLKNRFPHYHPLTLSTRGMSSMVVMEGHPCSPMLHQHSSRNLTRLYSRSGSGMLSQTHKVSARHRVCGSGGPGWPLMTLITHNPLIEDLASDLGSVCGSSCEGLGMITTAGVQGAAPLGYIRSERQIQSVCRCMHVHKNSSTSSCTPILI